MSHDVSCIIDRTGKTPLMRAIIEKNSEKACKLIDETDCMPEHINNTGQTALLLACDKLRFKIAYKLLVKYGEKCKVGHVDKQNMTALLYVSRMSMTTRYKEFTKKLIFEILQYDCNANHICDDLYSPLGMISHAMCSATDVFYEFLKTVTVRVKDTIYEEYFTITKSVNLVRTIRHNVGKLL